MRFRSLVLALILSIINGYAPVHAQGVPASVLTPPKGDGPLVVHVAFQLADINDIDDEEETFQFSGVLTLTWKDPRQAFDPSKEQVREKIYQGSYQFDELAPGWFPQVILKNEAGTLEKRGTILRVLPDGTSTLIEALGAVAESRLNMRRYPFDSQQLQAVFELFGFDSDEVVLEIRKDAPTEVLESFTISQWQFDGVQIAPLQVSAPFLGSGKSASAFTVTMSVERQSLFMMRLIVLPLMAIVMLSWSVFWMDRSSLGDRINISFVGILTAVAYQIVVGELLPQISYVTLMNGFLNISFLCMCASVVVNLVVGAYDKRGMAGVGDIIDLRSRWIFPLVYFSAIAITVLVMFLLF